MDKKIRNKIALGFIVATGSVLFIIGIFQIGKKDNLYSATFHVDTYFNDINGLREGDFVRYSGAKVGIVEKITFLNDTLIRVRMKIEQSMQPFIKNDALAYIGTEGLVGNKLINLKSGHKSRQSIRNNETLTGINPFNTEEIIERLIATSEDASSLVGNLNIMSKKLNDKRSIFKTLIDDTTASSEFKSIISNIKITSDKLNSLTDDFEKTVQKVNLGEGLAGTLLSDTMLSRELKDALANLKLSSEYAGDITGKLKQSIEENGTFNLLMKDTALANSLRRSVINLEQGTGKLNNNMDALSHNVFLKNYFKRKRKKDKILSPR